MPLRLLHLSDIHFQGYDAGWDEDEDQRGELLRDLGPLVDRDGPMDGVLVGGDIAFSARADQYETAREWLDQVLEVSGNLDRSRVWTVPGNHDVDIAMLKQCQQALDFRRIIRSSEAAALDSILHKRLSRDPGAPSLMLPLEQYNQFAALFGCSVLAHRPQWFDETLELDGWHVRLTGLNTVLTSDLEDGTSPEQQLVLGTQQCRIPRKQGMVHIVMAHHPPSWLRDWPLIEPYLRRGHIWLFGHEHAYAARQVSPRGSVEISAGAVGPERTDAGEVDPYVPTYNVITLRRRPSEVLEVEVQPRYWLRASTCFGPHPDGVATFSVDLASGDLEPSTLIPSSSEPERIVEADSPIEFNEGQERHDANSESIAVRGSIVESEDDAATAASPLVEELPERPSIDDTKSADRYDLRRLGVQFMGSSVTTRRLIARRLGVLEDDDLQLAPLELYPLLLKRIRERDLIEALSEEMKW